MAGGGGEGLFLECIVSTFLACAFLTGFVRACLLCEPKLKQAASVGLDLSTVEDQTGYAVLDTEGKVIEVSGLGLHTESPIW